MMKVEVFNQTQTASKAETSSSYTLTPDDTQTVNQAQQAKQTNSVQASTTKASSDIEIHFLNESGIIQNVLKDNLTDEIIRKLPSDEYLALLTRLSNLVDEEI